MTEIIYHITYTVNFPVPDRKKILEAIHIVASRHGLKFRDVAQPLRVALTGSDISPPIDDVWELIGESRGLNRITDAIGVR